MSTDASSLTAEDLEFLRRPLYGFVSMAGGPLPPQPRPVWFEATAEGTIQLFTGPDSLKVRHLRHDPRASIVVDWTPDEIALFGEGVARAAARLGVTPVPPGTLIGVAALDVPEHLVEVEATAVLE